MIPPALLHAGILCMFTVGRGLGRPCMCFAAGDTFGDQAGHNAQALHDDRPCMRHAAEAASLPLRSRPCFGPGSRLRRDIVRGGTHTTCGEDPQKRSQSQDILATSRPKQIIPPNTNGPQKRSHGLGGGGAGGGGGGAGGGAIQPPTRSPQEPPGHSPTRPRSGAVYQTYKDSYRLTGAVVCIATGKCSLDAMCKI